MQKLQLVEHQELAVDLTVTQRDQLKTALERAVIQPVPGSETAYLVNPKNHVGVVRAGDLTVEITPKLEISRVLFLVACLLLQGLEESRRELLVAGPRPVEISVESPQRERLQPFLQKLGDWFMALRPHVRRNFCSKSSIPGTKRGVGHRAGRIQRCRSAVWIPAAG